MGRLFWKFFIFIWLAQVAASLGVAAIFWMERQQDHARWEQALEARGIPVPPHAREGWHGPPHGPGFGAGEPPPPGEAGPPRDFRGPLHRGAMFRGPRLPWIPLVVGLFASLACAALLARYFSRPIRSLRSAFDAAAGGDLGVRVSAAMGKRRDELADLGRDFDRMAGQLESLMGGQKRLLHDVSHELRSPLARLQAAIGLARQQPVRVAEWVERIDRESGRMDRLVGELLTLSRLEAGVAGTVEEVDLADTLAAIADDARFEVAGKGVRVAYSGTVAGVVRGNGELIHRAIENVVRNAIKHSPAGSVVTIGPAEGDGTVAIDDCGPGVAESELAAIFEPFYRSGASRDTDGHGLGLAIARRVVEGLGGRIVASNRPGGGLRVEIRLPIAA